ncbi:MAG: hypothetical protein HRU19_03910 [Pseudobacteriovorax sp.]|nr:hypothetical protein [Pseudobacteriovorax sp.]
MKFPGTDVIKLPVRWSQFSVVKAVGLAVAILICGYSASLFTMIDAIRSLGPLVYDEKIEAALDEELFRIKRENQLQRELLLYLLQEEYGRQSKLEVESLKQFIATLNMPDSSLLGIINIEDAKTGTQIEWESPERLKVLNLRVDLPLDAVKQQFNDLRKLKQRYQLIKGTWDDQIGPTLVAVHSIILIATFAILGGALFILVQRYRLRVIRLLDGFSQWSEKDASFRFVEEDFKDELKIIAGQFNQLAEEVEINRKKTLYLEKMASWQTMARKMAHEIKNPLTPIKMMVSHLVRTYKGGDLGYQKILDDSQEIIVQEVNSLGRMVDSFSKFAQLPEPKFEQGDFKQLCQHVVDLQKAAREDRSITFDTNIAEATIFADLQLIRQVIMNIVKNAAEASADSAIQVSLSEASKWWVAKIHDDGPGIPDDLQSRIFEAYFTTKHTGETHGMGLGLAICKKIILDHNGELSVTSEPGNTTFSVTIPKVH